MVEYFEYDELVRATERFSPARLVGKGSHGSVYVAELPNRHQPVAVKTPLHRAHSHHLRNEIRLLSSLRHTCSHVISFLGTCHSDHLLVTEYLPNGSLHRLLHVSESPPPWSDRLRIAAEVATALRFLHDEAAVVHRDVKPENVLFDAGFAAKLADFGLAVDLGGAEEEFLRPAGTIGYMDPGYTSPENLSPKNDAFSFGVLVLQLVSGRRAVDVSRDPAGVVEWAVPLIRDRRTAEVCDVRVSPPDGAAAAAVERLLVLAAGCVSMDEDCRPAMSDVVSAMECRFLERDRFNVWTSLCRSVAFMKRRRKTSKRRREGGGGGRKMLLREILALESERADEFD